MRFTESQAPKLPSAQQMQSWDRQTVDFGLPEQLLMENASRSAIKLLESLAGPLNGKNILSLMGGGNNGGDAVCMARILHDQGACALVAHTKNLDELKGAARFHTDLALKDEVPFKKLDPADFQEFLLYLERIGFKPDIILDGLIGVALRGALSEEMRILIEKINFYIECIKPFVLAIDVPSGLNANTGEPMPAAVKAQATACMAFAKKGLVLPCSRSYTGQVYVCDIGMPKILASTRIPDLYLLDGRALLSAAEPPQNAYKNLFGHVVVIGGQDGLSGAARLASMAALRSGAGLVTACAPQASIYQVKGGLAEIMTLAAGEGENWPSAVPGRLAALIQNSQALAIGPGLGRGLDAAEFLHSLLTLPYRPRAVLDADALFHLAENPHWLSMLSENDVITPHPGEAARLLNRPTRDLEKERLAALTELMEKVKAVVVLKGANTLIGKGALPALLCPFDIPQMAIGGAGDVLTGCLAAGLAKRAGEEDTVIVSAKAVISHVCAGMICARKYPQRGALASDLANALAHAHEFVNSLDQTDLIRGLAPWPG